MFSAKIYTDIDTFIQVSFPVVLKNELENNLFISNAMREKNGGRKNDLKITIMDSNNQVIFAAIHMNPYNLVLVEANPSLRDKALPILIKTLINNHVDFPGVISEQSLADAFVEMYSKVVSFTPETKLSLNLMQLTQVIQQPKTEGKLRLGTVADLHFLPYWQNAFTIECGIHVRSINEAYENLKGQIENGSIYIWECGGPVACVSSSRAIYTGKTIAFVYTPPYYRNKGYASACVAAVSQILLDQGAAFCGLFADCKNPISNAIYHRIGYKNHSICKEIMFIR